MSTAHDAHTEDAHAAHDPHAFDPEPVRTLSSGEPRTPGWLPILGLLLFVGAGIWFLAGAEAPPAPPPKPPEPQAAVAPPAPQPMPVRPPAIQPARPGAAPPLPSGGVRRLSPAQLDLIRKQIEQRRKLQGAPAPRPAPATTR